MSYYAQQQYAQNQYEGYKGWQSHEPRFSDPQQYEQQNHVPLHHHDQPEASYTYNHSQQQQVYTPPPLNQSSFTSFSTSHQHTGNVAAGLSYVCFWLTGLLFLLFERKNRLVRFHAMQSLLFFGGVNVLYVVFLKIMIEHIPFLRGFAIFAFVIMNIVATIAWIVGMVGAFNGKFVKLPFVGDIAENYVNSDIHLK